MQLCSNYGKFNFLLGPGLSIFLLTCLKDIETHVLAQHLLPEICENIPKWGPTVNFNILSADLCYINSV